MRALGQHMTTREAFQQGVSQLHSSVIKSGRSMGAMFVVVVVLGVCTIFALAISLEFDADIFSGKPGPRRETAPQSQNPMAGLRENPRSSPNRTSESLGSPRQRGVGAAVFTWEESLPLMQHYRKEQEDAARAATAKAARLDVAAESEGLEKFGFIPPTGDPSLAVAEKVTPPGEFHDGLLDDFSRMHLIPEMVVPEEYEVTMSVPSLSLMEEQDFGRVFLHINDIHEQPLYLAKFVNDRQGNPPGHWRLMLMSPVGADLSASCGLRHETIEGQTQRSVMIYRASGSVFGKLSPMKLPGSYCVSTNLSDVSYTFTAERDGEVNFLDQRGLLLAQINMGKRPGAIRTALVTANVDTSLVVLCVLGIDWLNYENSGRT